MGGSGSGRSAEKWTVEECRSLSVSKMRRNNQIIPGLRTWGSKGWTQWDRPAGSINYDCRFDLDPPFLRIYYTCAGNHDKREESYDYRIYIKKIQLYFGGFRLFFLCPGCGRQVVKLYAKGPLFRCRICHNLTYWSCQDSHKFDLLNRYLARSFGVSVEKIKQVLKAHAKSRR